MLNDFMIYAFYCSQSKYRYSNINSIYGKPRVKVWLGDKSSERAVNNNRRQFATESWWGMLRAYTDTGMPHANVTLTCCPLFANALARPLPAPSCSPTSSQGPLDLATCLSWPNTCPPQPPHPAAKNRPGYFIFTLSHVPRQNPTIVKESGLASVAQLVGVSSWSHRPKGHRFIPGQGTRLGCGFDPQSGHVEEAMDWCFSLTSMFLCFSLLRWG